MTHAIETLHCSALLPALWQREERKRGKENLATSPRQDLSCASSGKANSHHSDYGRFTLQSLKPKLAAPLIAMDIYQAHSRTQNSTKLAYLFMFSWHAIGCKHLLIQLWISRVTAEGALVTVYVLLSAFQLEAHQSPCSLHFSRSSQGCAPSVTRRTVTRQQRARRIYGIRSRNCTHKQRGECAAAPTSATSAHSHPHALLAPHPPLPRAHSFLLQQHKSYHACCQGRESEEQGRNREDGRRRKWQGFGSAALLSIFLNTRMRGGVYTVDACVCVCTVFLSVIRSVYLSICQ